jgi:GT2 family glycosyltransferase
LRKQDIPVAIFIVDNGSKDETVAYAQQEGILLAASEENTGFSAGINLGLKLIFGPIGAEHCLVVGSDTILPPWFYSSMLSYNLPFVSGVAVEDMDQIANPPERSEPVPHPDFSAWLTTKDLWNKLGGFSEDMVSWASDCDLHVRAHRLGINLWKTNTPFFHVRSRTIELAPSREKRAFQMQADADRLTFAEKWKARVGSPQYQELFSPDSFGIDAD